VKLSFCADSVSTGNFHCLLSHLIASQGGSRPVPIWLTYFLSMGSLAPPSAWGRQCTSLSAGAHKSTRDLLKCRQSVHVHPVRSCVHMHGARFCRRTNLLVNASQCQYTCWRLCESCSLTHLQAVTQLHYSRSSCTPNCSMEPGYQLSSLAQGNRLLPTMTRGSLTNYLANYS
jgi:hypothetical protein